MGITLGGQSDYPAHEVIRACNALGKPITDWPAKVNRFMSSLGDTPGRGWFLMTRRSLNAIAINSPITLIFNDGVNPRTTIPNVMIVPSPMCVLGGTLGDLNAVYLVEVADARWLAENPFYATPINSQYNVRAPAGEETYYKASINSGTPWTWQGMLDDLWATITVTSPTLGTSPVLPRTPDGTPENFKFLGCSAWSAYNSILRRLTCAIGLDYTNGGVAYIELIGGPDPLFVAAAAKYAGKPRLFDEDVIDVSQSKIAANVQIFHHVFGAYGTESTTGSDTTTPQWSTSPLYSSIIGPVNPIPNLVAGSVQVIFDDLPAVLNFDGTVANTTALASRDAERAADYYRIMNQVRMHRVYAGALADIGLLPGGQVSAICWMYQNKRYMTEVINTVPQLRASDMGQWVECWDKVNERLQPPDLGRATFPNYPDTVQQITVGTVTSTAGVYNGIVQKTNPSSLANVDNEDCYITGLNGETLMALTIVPGRLNSVKTISGMTLPLYTLISGGGGSTGTSHTLTVVTGVSCTAGALAVVTKSITYYGP